MERNKVFEKIYTKIRVENWSSNYISPYCSSCENVCCDSSRILINISEQETESLKLFTDQGLRLYRLKELDFASVKNWVDKTGKRGMLGKSELAGKVLTREKTEVEKPSLIEAPLPVWNGETFVPGGETDIALYADSCPFYVEEKGCLIHEDPRRPDSCKQYPLTFEIEEEKSAIVVHDSCPPMNNPEIRKQLERDFPNIQVVSRSEILTELMMQRVKSEKAWKVRGRRIKKSRRR